MHSIDAHAAAAAVTTWIEFSDVVRKVERYSNAVNSLKQLMAWWKVLGFRV
jgi:hypothetical protein